jgi:hypothetical protein
MKNWSQCLALRLLESFSKRTESLGLSTSASGLIYPRCYVVLPCYSALFESFSVFKTSAFRLSTILCTACSITACIPDCIHD